VTLNNLSQIYKAQGDIPTALKYIQQSLEIQQQIGDKKGEGTTLNNLSQIYHIQGYYPTALKYLQQSLEIRQKIGDKAGLCITLFNIANIYFENKELEKAMQTWIEVYQIAQSIGLAKALNALENLAPQIGLSNGLKSWALLAEKSPTSNQ